MAFYGSRERKKEPLNPHLALPTSHSQQRAFAASQNHMLRESSSDQTIHNMCSMELHMPRWHTFVGAPKLTCTQTFSRPHSVLCKSCMRRWPSPSPSSFNSPQKETSRATFLRWRRRQPSLLLRVVSLKSVSHSALGKEGRKREKFRPLFS